VVVGTHAILEILVQFSAKVCLVCCQILESLTLHLRESHATVLLKKAPCLKETGAVSSALVQGEGIELACRNLPVTSNVA
jgi:hypothetical protein